MSTLRGYAALVLLLFLLLLCDPVQRLVVAPWARLAPSRRVRILTRWQEGLAWLVLRLLSGVGGAHIPAPPSIPSRPGTLVVMNHQSVLDIPLVVAAMTGGYPLIVTRRRYFRWIPLISHMLRLYQYPVVDPAANAEGTRAMLEELGALAEEVQQPLVIFPEGTRTRNGEIGRFKTRGLREILTRRPWTVHVLVADGFWERAKMKHFVAGMGRIHGRVEHLGSFEWADPAADPDEFIAMLRGRMVERLAHMRGTVPA